MNKNLLINAKQCGICKRFILGKVFIMGQCTSHEPINNFCHGFKSYCPSFELDLEKLEIVLGE